MRVSEHEWIRILAHAEKVKVQPSTYMRTATLDLIAKGGRLPVSENRAGAQERRDLREIGVLLKEIDSRPRGCNAEVVSLLPDLQRWIVLQVRGQ